MYLLRFYDKRGRLNIAAKVGIRPFPSLPRTKRVRSSNTWILETLLSLKYNNVSMSMLIIHMVLSASDVSISLLGVEVSLHPHPILLPFAPHEKLKACKVATLLKRGRRRRHNKQLAFIPQKVSCGPIGPRHTMLFPVSAAQYSPLPLG